MQAAWPNLVNDFDCVIIKKLEYAPPDLLLTYSKWELKVIFAYIKMPKSKCVEWFHHPKYSRQDFRIAVTSRGQGTMGAKSFLWTWPTYKRHNNESIKWNTKCPAEVNYFDIHIVLSIKSKILRRDICIDATVFKEQILINKNVEIS